jgi:two-component system, OmpR family, sensor histidine kinase BaeS
VPDTPSPNARSTLRSFRLRLVLAFALVVAVALALVLATLPRLLDGYFQQQEQLGLKSRADAVATLVAQQLKVYGTIGAPATHPILNATEPMTASQSTIDALGSAEAGFLHDLTPKVAMADVTVAIAPAPDDPVPVYAVTVPLADSAGASGQQREPLTATSDAVDVADTWWTASPAGAPTRVITATLSNPFTDRAQTIGTIANVLLGAATLALLVAIVASVLLAQRLTIPIHRLTRASRALAEGQLDSRVAVSPHESSEVAELAGAFNNMAERLQESIDVISQDRDRSRAFLADVSHELRTPIAALRTFNELLQGGAGDDTLTRTEFLGQSARQIDRLEWLATNLLDISKLDSGLVALDLRPDDLRTAVENAVEQAQPVADRKGVTLAMHTPDAPVRQLHDPPRIGQVLANLIGNALRFTPQGGRVDVDLEATATGAQLAITDTGIGIPAEELPHVFERFYRGTALQEERDSGSGLGLAIVKSIVDMHEGRITIQTSPGAGTQVIVTLPLHMTNSSSAAAPQ